MIRNKERGVCKRAEVFYFTRYKLLICNILSKFQGITFFEICSNFAAQKINNNTK